MRRYLSLFYAVDWFVLGLAVIIILLSFYPWQSIQQGQRVQIYQEGELYQEVDLSVQKIIEVKGPLGITRVEINQGRVRILADPSPRQYCVKEGWLEKVGQLAICLPNHTSITIVGKNQESGYDSLNY